MRLMLILMICMFAGCAQNETYEDKINQFIEFMYNDSTAVNVLRLNSNKCLYIFKEAKFSGSEFVVEMMRVPEIIDTNQYKTEFQKSRAMMQYIKSPDKKVSMQIDLQKIPRTCDSSNIYLHYYFFNSQAAVFSCNYFMDYWKGHKKLPLGMSFLVTYNNDSLKIITRGVSE